MKFNFIPKRLTKKERLALLVRTRELIAQGFTRGQLKRKNSRAKEGYSYCLLGAAEEAYRELFPEHVEKFTYFDGYALEAGKVQNKEPVMQQLSVTNAIKKRSFGSGSAVYFNDMNGKEAVLEVLDERIDFYSGGSK